MATRKQPGPTEERLTDKRKAAEYALTELRVIRGSLAASETRLMKSMEKSGWIPQSGDLPYQVENLGEVLFHALHIIHDVNKLLFKTSNRLRGTLGAQPVNESEQSILLGKMYDELLGDAAQEMMETVRRSGGTFAPSHASVRRDERPPSTTRPRLCDDI